MNSFLEQVFGYDPLNPMIFTSGLFWVFFGLVLLIYQNIYEKLPIRNLFLFLVSIFFYYKLGGFFFVLILISTLVDYSVGQGIYRSQHRPRQTALLVLSLVVNLGFLAYYKYTYFFTDLINMAAQTDYVAKDFFALWANHWWGTEFDISKIILPVGISFYTFQTLSYTIDIYRRKIQPVNNILDFAFYVSFFPQLVAGPIVRAADFTPQIYQNYRLSAEEYGRAIFLILNGLVKKMLISDYISVNFVDRVFENPSAHSGFENLMAVYGYAIQIYCDFSGYTDIAIGLALLLGFRLNINFNSPYIATSITDFWRRWHISLSSWLRDYLYIPLGGNRGTSLFTYMSIPAILLIFIFVDGWTDIALIFYVLILTIWIMSRIFPEYLFFTYLDFALIVLFLLTALSAAHWYTSFALGIILVLWIVVFVKPKTSRSVSTYANLMLTMLLGGLWHGASTRFIIWGALHGLALAVHKFWLEATHQEKVEPRGWRKFIGQVITFHFVCYCWIYFRADNTEIIDSMLGQMAFSFQWGAIPQILVGYQQVFLIMLAAYVIHWLPKSFKEEVQAYFIALPDYAKAALISLIVIGLYQAKTADIQPFIYFQF